MMQIYVKTRLPRYDRRGAGKARAPKEIGFFTSCCITRFKCTYFDWSFYDRLGKLISDMQTVENPFPLIVLPLV